MRLNFNCLALFATMGFLIGSALADQGVIEVRVTDHKPAIKQFQKLDVTLDYLAVHAKGMPRNKGWAELSFAASPIDIVPLKDGVYVSLGELEVPIGLYDAMRIRFAHVSGDLKSGESPTMVADDTTVGISLNVAGSNNQPVVIDLYAEDQSEHEPPIYVVKVKEVRKGK